MPLRKSQQAAPSVRVEPVHAPLAKAAFVDARDSVRARLSPAPNGPGRSDGLRQPFALCIEENRSPETLPDDFILWLPTALAEIHVGRHVVLEPEVPALRRPLRCHQCNISTQPRRLLLKIA
jgi:hypothetical protein